jgi:PAS domain S-box-containing protein
MATASPTSKETSCDDQKQLEADKILYGQTSPAIVVSHTLQVLAGNNGSQRLFSHLSTQPGALHGSHISNLGIVLTPVHKPILRTWDDILSAVQEEFSSQAAELNKDDSPDEDPSLGQDTTSKSFWTSESAIYPVATCEVLIPTIDAIPQHDAAPSVGPNSMIKAVVQVSSRKHESELLFLMIFTPRASKPVSEPLSTPLQTFGNQDSRELASESFFPPLAETQPSSHMMSLESKKAINTIIPFIMSILDADGQVLELSASWFEFSGLSRGDSIASEWASAIHKDDVGPMMEDWAKTLKNARDHWTWKARYRCAADGKYYWFLIRAQPLKDDSGKIIRWFSSMIDINEWVFARIEADAKRQSILDLLSKTNVCLWGVDQNHKLHIREGALDWNPSTIEQFLGLPAHGVSLPAATPNPTPEVLSERAMAQVILCILEGQEFNASVDHQEGIRSFRTCFTVDHHAHERGLDGQPCVTAALAMTYEVTDVKARAALQLANERLVMDEQASKDSSDLKSTFLANVRTIPSRSCFPLLIPIDIS